MLNNGSQAHGQRWGLTAFCNNGTHQCYLWDASDDIVSLTIAQVQTPYFRAQQRASAAFGVMSCIFAGTATLISGLIYFAILSKEKHLFTMVLFVLVSICCAIVVPIWVGIQNNMDMVTSYGAGLALFATCLGVSFFAAILAFAAKNSWDGNFKTRQSMVWLLLFSAASTSLIIAGLSQGTMVQTGSLATGTRYGVTFFCTHGTSYCSLWDGQSDNVTSMRQSVGISVDGFQAKQRAAAAFGVLGSMSAGVAAVFALLGACVSLAPKKHVITTTMLFSCFCGIIVVGLWGSIANDMNSGNGETYAYGASFINFSASIVTSFCGAVIAYVEANAESNKISANN